MNQQPLWQALYEKLLLRSYTLPLQQFKRTEQERNGFRSSSWISSRLQIRSEINQYKFWQCYQTYMRKVKMSLVGGMLLASLLISLCACTNPLNVNLLGLSTPTLSNPIRITSAPAISPSILGPASTRALVMEKTYYVSSSGSDKNNGSRAHPFATIQRAANLASSGITVDVLPGIYTTPLVTRKSGTATARITYVSDKRWGAEIKTTGVRDSWLNGGDYVDVIGFDITGNGAIGINNQGSYVRIIGNLVHNIPAACDSNGGAGIDNANFAARDDDIIDNVVHDIGPFTTCNTVHGIYQSNLYGQIYNNISYRNAAWGIHLWHAANAVIVANNLVFANRRGGIAVGASDAPGGVMDDNTVVSNNIIIHNYGPAIEEYGNTGTHNRYLNNLVFANASGIELQNGLTAQGTLTVNPGLVNYKVDGSGNYHLKAGSPCIDAGVRTNAPSTDFAGISRPQEGAYDIGPYAYVP